MYSLQITFDVTGDRRMFERVAERLRKPVGLMRMIGQHAVGQAAFRLTQVLSQDSGAVRTGALEASLTVFEATDQHVVVGSNLPYARQVHHGGRIEPVPPGKALAIPLDPSLQRLGIGPAELDPQRELLSFVPMRGGASGNVIGLLVDDEGEFGFGEGEALFALATHVDQEPRPYLYFDDEDRQVIGEDLVPAWLEIG